MPTSLKIQWEYDLVEKPFCEQLTAMGWQWLEGDTSGQRGYSWLY